MDRQCMVICTILVTSGIFSWDTALAFKVRAYDDQLSKRQQTTPNYFGSFNPNSMMTGMLGGGGDTGMGMFNPNTMMGGGDGGNMFNPNAILGGGGTGGGMFSMTGGGVMSGGGTGSGTSQQNSGQGTGAGSLQVIGSSGNNPIGTGSNSGSGGGSFDPNQASSGGGSGTGSTIVSSGGSFDPNHASGAQGSGTGEQPGLNMGGGSQFSAVGGIPSYDPNNAVNTGAKYDPNSANAGMNSGGASPAFLTGMGLNPQRQQAGSIPPMGGASGSASGAGAGFVTPGTQQQTQQSQSGSGGSGNFDPNQASSGGSGPSQAAQSFGSSTGGSSSGGGGAPSSFGSGGSSSGFGSSQQSAGTGSTSGGQTSGGSGGSIVGPFFDPVKTNSIATDGFNPLSPVLGKDITQLMGPQANTGGTNPANFNPGAINSMMASNGASLNMFGGVKLGGDPSKMDASTLMSGGNAFNSGAMGAGGTGTKQGSGTGNGVAINGGGMNMFDPNAMMGGGSINPMMPGGGGMNPMMPGGSMMGGTNTNTNTMTQGSTGMNPMGVNQLDPLGAMLGGAKNFSGGSNLIDPMGFMNGGGLSGSMKNMFDLGKQGRNAGILKDAASHIVRRMDLSSGLMVQTGGAYNPIDPLGFQAGQNTFGFPFYLSPHAERNGKSNFEKANSSMLSPTETTSKEPPLGLMLTDLFGNIISDSMNQYSGFASGYPEMLGTRRNPSLGASLQTLKLQQQDTSPNNSSESRDPPSSSQISLTSGFISGYPGMLGPDNPKMALFQNQMEVSGTNNGGHLYYGTDRGGHLSNGYSSSNFGTDSSFKPGFFGQIDSVDTVKTSGQSRDQSEFGNTVDRLGELSRGYSTDDFGTDTFGQIGSSNNGHTSSMAGDHSGYGNSVDAPGSQQTGEAKISSHTTNWNGEWPGQTSGGAGVNTETGKSQPGDFGPQAFGGTEPKAWDGNWAEGWPGLKDSKTSDATQTGNSGSTSESTSESDGKTSDSAKVLNDLIALLGRMTANSE